MGIAVVLLALAAGVLVVTTATSRFGLSAPLVLMLVGIAISFVPFVPDLHLEPEVVLLGLLPPLLYGTAIRTSVIDFRRQLGPIAALSIGLVVVTALLVGLLTWGVLGLPFGAAFAIGAVVAPPDAVAASAVAKRIGLPRRLVSLLEGESLVNDATAITCLRMGIVALGATVTTWQVGGTFLWALFGGMVIGGVAALVISRFRRHITDPRVDTAVSFIAPFLAYLPAEAAESSGVIAVVTCGLILGHRAPIIQTAPSRLSERSNWATIEYLLENAVFLLIGLQANWIVGEVADSPMPWWRSIGYCLLVLVAVMVIRIAWCVGFVRLFQGRKALGGATPLRTGLLTGWAGMRGVVTLAAALLLPVSVPHRELLLLAAMVVTAGTLLINGLTLGPLARRLRITGPDPRQDALALAGVLERAGSRALTRLEELRAERGRPADEPDPALDEVRRRISARTNAIWERLGRNGGGMTPTQEYRKLRLLTLHLERKQVLQMRADAGVEQEVIGRALGTLDVEESMLAGAESALAPIEDDPLTAPAADVCEHLQAAPDDVERASGQCLDCVREGTVTVHLRMCLACGNVGCCDSSPARHATRHFHDSGHPVIRSIEPGESWRWCYVDESLG